MTSRILPPEEWPRLAGTELDGAYQTLPPHAQIVVVEDNGQIVACWSLFAVWHVEGLWTAPTHRAQPSVVFRLVGAMKRLVRAQGVRSVYTAACSEDVRALITRFGGTQVPADAYMLPLGGSSSCHS